jgi:cytochrome c553
VSGTTAVAYLSHLERDNRFCIACHHPDGKRLHGDLFDRHEAKPPVNLSAAHAAAKKAVRCWRCHKEMGTEQQYSG